MAKLNFHTSTSRIKYFTFYEIFFSRPEYRLSAEGCGAQLERWEEGEVDWRQVFVERYKLRRAWMGGQCHVRTFEGHSGGISCVQFDGGRIVSGSHDKTIKVWNVKTNSPWSVITLAGHSGEVRCLHLGTFNTEKTFMRSISKYLYLFRAALAGAFSAD